jgi:hypothetical protein
MNPSRRSADYRLDREELAQHRARVFAALSRHSDPVLREMGRQLARHGVLTPHELIAMPHYADTIVQGRGMSDAPAGNGVTMAGLTSIAATEPAGGDAGVPAGP